MYPAGFSDRNPTLNLPYAVNTASKPAALAKKMARQMAMHSGLVTYSEVFTGCHLTPFSSLAPLPFPYRYVVEPYVTVLVKLHACQHSSVMMRTNSITIIHTGMPLANKSFNFVETKRLVDLARLRERRQTLATALLRHMVLGNLHAADRAVEY